MADLKTILIAIASGIIPVFVWLWFWLKEDKEHPEPKGLIIITFFLGMLAVNLVLPLEKLAQKFIESQALVVTAWAGIEEIFKYLAAATVALRSRFADEPVDYPIYMLTAALGFAAFENILFLLNPANSGGTLGLIVGNLRFLGATLLHAVASSVVGIALGLAFYREKYRKYYLLAGLTLAIALHTLFNFFIMRAEGNNFLRTFAFVWVVAIIIILLFEKLRRMGPYPHPASGFQTQT